ncbi:MAG: hypothetical protein IPQ06_05630 [Chitinophagaceae bacterium]|nr:hypothetical protein [Chitinophagaceae bacterium]
MKKKIVIWCGDAPNQKALASKIDKNYFVAGIVIEKKRLLQKKNIIFLAQKIWNRVRFNSIYNAWTGLQNDYESQYSQWPKTQMLITDSINSKETEDFTRKLGADLIVVSGTSLIKKNLLDIDASIGILNLHTGLSPYVKGGPNCTNWCIANNDWHLVGNTIMWIDAGIDSGNILTSEVVDIKNSNSLFAAQKMVMEHAHELYLRAITYLFNNKPPYISIKQSVFSEGKNILY